MRKIALGAGTLALIFGTFLALGADVARGATLDGGESALLDQINGFRSANGLPTLVASDTLTVAAKWMATDMSTRNYFSHTSADGRSPTQRMADAGYPTAQTWTGEDLAAGYSSAAEVLSGWIKSPSHLAVLMNPEYHAVGLGRAFGAGSAYGWYWDADFGGLADRGATAASFDLGFHDAYVGQSPDPTLAPGQVTTLVLALRNTGYRGWYVGSPGQQAFLGTADPVDVARPDLAYHWIALNRIATTTTDYVGPGETGWFQFQVRAPAAPGTYQLRVRAVVDGTTWLEDQGVSWTITVR